MAGGEANVSECLAAKTMQTLRYRDANPKRFGCGNLAAAVACSPDVDHTVDSVKLKSD